MTEPWCVVLASREDSHARSSEQGCAAALQHPASNRFDPFHATLRRAATVTSLDRIAAVVAAPVVDLRRRSFNGVSSRNLLIQPQHRGTGYEVLLALLHLQNRISPATAVLFLPGDHTVNDEEVMTNSLMSMAEWIADEPRPVYLLGATPEGPHDELGYILPWHHGTLMPSGLYEFVERPDMRRARQLINLGSLWNTFIFGGTLASLISLFRPRFDAPIAALRAALRSDQIEVDLNRSYDGFTPIDFSRDLLATQTEKLNVLRLPRCGWWPLKSPTLNSDPQMRAQ